jgi:MFS family permease
MMLSFAPLIGVIASDLKIDLGTASFGFMGIHTLCIAIGAFLTGQIIHRVNAYALFVISLLVLGISNGILPWIGHSYHVVLIIRILEGLAIAPVLVAYAPVVSAWFPVNERGVANALQAISLSLGMALSVAVGPILFEAVGNWQEGLAWLSVGPAVSLAIVLVIASFKKRPPAREGEDFSGESSLVSEHFRQALRQPGFWAGALCYCTGVWVIQAFNDLTPGYFAVEPPVGVGFGPVLAGKLMVVVMISGMIGSLAGGFLSDRFGRRPIVITGHLINTIFCGSVIFSFVYGNYFILVPVLFLIGTGPQIVNSQTLAFACSFPSSIVGKTVGIWVCSGQFIGAVGVMIGSFALQRTGNYHVSIIIVSLVGLVGLMSALFLKMPEFGRSRS